MMPEESRIGRTGIRFPQLGCVGSPCHFQLKRSQLRVHPRLPSFHWPRVLRCKAVQLFPCGSSSFGTEGENQGPSSARRFSQHFANLLFSDLWSLPFSNSSVCSIWPKQGKPACPVKKTNLGQQIAQPSYFFWRGCQWSTIKKTGVTLFGREKSHPQTVERKLRAHPSWELVV